MPMDGTDETDAAPTRMMINDDRMMIDDDRMMIE